MQTLNSMGSLIDQIIFVLGDLKSGFIVHFANRTVFEMLLFFFPIFLFAELPRYVLPSVVLLIGRLAGRLGDDSELKQRFLATHPSISVLLVGHNEADSVGRAIESLLEFDYPNMEIIAVDDGSTDDMYEVCRPYADRGLIKLVRNGGPSGRTGRPAGSNLGLSFAKNEFILSVDADTSFDRSTLLHMIGPFHDPKVGVVAGNLKVRNFSKSYWTRMQSLEYFQTISVWKRWLNLLGWNMQASGAFGAFRRTAMLECGGWDSELAEDADISLKLKRAGWGIVFAPEAVAMTNVPATAASLILQRYRWDRGLLRTYFHKHGDLLRFWKTDWRNSAEMALEYFFTIMTSYLYVVWLVYFLFANPIMLVYIYPIAYTVYFLSSLLTIGVGILFSERKDAEWPQIPWVVLFPLYKGMLRWVRLYSITLEAFRINYADTYLPESAWRNTPRW